MSILLFWAKKAVGPVPTPPSTLVATAVSATEIDLTWVDTAGDQSGFLLERCTGVGCSGFVQIASLGATVRTYQDQTLTSSTTYQYRIRAYNANGNSAYSNTASATTFSTAGALQGGGTPGGGVRRRWELQKLEQEARVAAHALEQPVPEIPPVPRTRVYRLPPPDFRSPAEPVIAPAMPFTSVTHVIPTAPVVSDESDDEEALMALASLL